MTESDHSWVSVPLRHFPARDGVVLGYRRRLPLQPGAAPPLLLLHGAASNSTRWWHYVANTRLNDRTLLCPDLRGHGASVWRGPARMRHWTQDLSSLLAHEGAGRAIVVGHCLGANLAIRFAACYPELCAGLVLIEPMTRQALTGPMARLRWLAPLLDAAARVVGVANWLGFRRRTLVQVDLQELDMPVQAVRAAQAHDEALELKTHGSLRHDVQVVPLAQLLANFVELVRPLPLSGVRAPSLVIQASGRRMTDSALTRELFEGLLADAQYVELPAEHWIPTTHPQQLCELIDQWVLQLAAPRSRHAPGAPLQAP